MEVEAKVRQVHELELAQQRAGKAVEQRPEGLGRVAVVCCCLSLPLYAHVIYLFSQVDTQRILKTIQQEEKNSFIY